MGTNARWFSRLGLGLLLVSTAAISGCASWFGMGENLQTTIVPQSDFAREIQGLYELIFWVAALVFVVVEAVLIWAIIRFRFRPGAALPPQIHGNTVLEVGWTIAPAIVLFVVAIPTISTIFKTSSESAMGAGRGPALQIKVVGHQWWWEFEYPDQQVITPNEVHVPVGQPVAFALESADVIHSFWVPRLGGKQDVVPHRTNHIYFTVDEPGMYWGQCVEFCGTQHANMKLRLIAHTPAEFQQWVQSQKAAPQPPTGDAEEGQKILLRSACVGCHTIDGTPAQGKVGPSLTHFGSRVALGAGVLDNTQDNLARWLRDPQEVKPGNLMPNLHLKEQDIQSLVAYLESLK